MNAVFQNFTNEESKNPGIVLALVDLLVGPLASILGMSNEKNYNGLVKNHASDVSASLLKKKTRFFYLDAL